MLKLIYRQYISLDFPKYLTSFTKHGTASRDIILDHMDTRIDRYAFPIYFSGIFFSLMQLFLI